MVSASVFETVDIGSIPVGRFKGMIKGLMAEWSIAMYLKYIYAQAYRGSNPF